MVAQLVLIIHLILLDGGGHSSSSFVDAIQLRFTAASHYSASSPSSLPESTDGSRVAGVLNTNDDVVYKMPREMISDAELGARILKWKYWNKRQSRIPRRRTAPPRCSIIIEERRADDLPTNEHEQRRELHQRRQLEKLISEMKETSPIYNTLQRSSKAKQYIEWQWDQDRSRQRRRGLNVVENRNTSSSLRSVSSSLNDRKYYHHRYLQEKDDFANAYNTGRPGSTYGNNMFCGSSWSEASTSCPGRQNCPSGQSSECILPGHECWAFTECDTLNGIDGRAFSDAHGVVGAENLAATGVGAQASGGYVDLNKPSFNTTDHSFCGVGYDDAVTKCGTHCPSGNLNDCPMGEICFTKTSCDARLLTIAPHGPTPTQEPTTPSPVVADSKLNKYYCGYDWKDAQSRCEIWCPSGSDDDCPADQLCMAFTECHAVINGGKTLKQIEKAKTQQETAVVAGDGDGSVGGVTNSGANAAANGGGGDDAEDEWWQTETDDGDGIAIAKVEPSEPTKRPTNKPSMSAEEAMHRYSFCGKFWDDARDNCETKTHCADDRDCPEFEFCWTQTPCDYYATEMPTTYIPTYAPSKKKAMAPEASAIKQKPTRKAPTKKPATSKPTEERTDFPTYSPTITGKPTDKPTYDADDPSLTFFCGISWDAADKTCGMRCPSGNSGDCPNELECWAFTSCTEERGIEIINATEFSSGGGGVNGTEPSPTTTVSVVHGSIKPTIQDYFVPGYGGALVPVFGGVNYTLLAPTSSPAPTISDVPSLIPSLPPEASHREKMASYFCGKDWADVTTNCYQPCPSGSNSECNDPEHICWAFVEPCRATMSPIGNGGASSPDLFPSLTSGSFTEPPVYNAGDDNEIDNSEFDEEEMIDNQGEDWEVDNKGEDWESDSAVNNEGEDWSTPEPTTEPTVTSEPTIPKEPTLKPTQDPTIDKLAQLEMLKTSYFCSESWESIDCEVAEECPSGDSNDCPGKKQCFSGTPCKSKAQSMAEDSSSEARPTGDNDSSPTPTIWTPLMGDEDEGDKEMDNEVDEEEPVVDEVSSKFFCGASWGELVENCDTAKSCPSGTNAECEGGQSCFANTPCGSSADSSSSANGVATSVFNFAAMVEKFPSHCKDDNTMSRNVGYWQSWSIYRDESCNPFTAKSIDATSYTHIVFSFASISDSYTLEPWDFEADIKGGQYQEFINVKKSSPGTKALIAVGGWTHNEPFLLDEKGKKKKNERLYRFMDTAATQKRRRLFAQSSVAFMRKYGFDGLDIDWEYPGDNDRGGNSATDKANLVLLCTELRKQFDDTPEKFELTMAIPASITRFDVGFDLLNLAPSIHFFNLMAYDLHGTWDEPRIVGAHSDISGIDEAVQYILTNSSVPASQVVLGLPAYGRSYTLSNETCTSLGCPFKKNSNVTAIGGCLDTKGFVPFVEIYKWESQGKKKGYESVEVDPVTQSAVMIKDDNQLISYDNSETFKSKVDYATSICLGGTMVWAIDMLPGGFGGGSDDREIGGGGGDGGNGNGDESAKQSVLTEEEAILAFCGKDWEDAISTCDRPCPSGTSDDCEDDEMCFAGTTCGEGGVATIAGNTCKICPDPTTQGVLSWVDVEVDIDGTVTATKCGDLDYGLLLSVTTESEICDSLKLEHGQKCCYMYPKNQCSLCKKDQVTFNVRSNLNVTMPDGTEASCGLVDKMIAPEESDGEKCITTQDKFFDDCCYIQCNLCNGQGLKWWEEFDSPAEESRRTQETSEQEEVGDNTDDEEQVKADSDEEDEETSQLPTFSPTLPMLTCSSIDASLYTDSIEAESDECLEIKNLYSSDCCYAFPTNACGVCKQGNTSQTLLWAETVIHDGDNITCGVVDNILNAEEDGSPTCESSKEIHFDSCCYAKCNLCDESEGQQLAWDFTVDYDDTVKTCGDIEAIFTANEVQSISEECSSIKAEYQDLCCFKPPTSPCTLCPEYVRWDEAVEFEGAKSTCKIASDMLKREENMTDTCSNAREAMDETCCYELCDVCGPTLLLDWDAVVEYDEKRISCGEFKPIFGRKEIEEGDEACSDIQSNYTDLCCYTPPTIPCNLCQTETNFLDAYSDKEVNFWGSAMNCSDLYDYLIRRIELKSDTCSSAKESITDECCYKKCSICSGNQLQDFDQIVELDGETISCQQLHTIRTVDIVSNSSECQSMQSQFSDLCCYMPPATPCVLCAGESVRKDVSVDFDGGSNTCEVVANTLGSRINNGTEDCTSSKIEFQEFCCMDKCSLCLENEQIDWDASVDFDGGTSCGSFDWYFTDNAIEEGSENCTTFQSNFRETCCYVPLNYSTPACSLCKMEGPMGDEWFDLNGNAMVYFEGSNKSCTEVSNSLYRKEEDVSGFCDAARSEYFPSCCFEKCDLCQGAQLDANIEVMYNDTATTCLKIGLAFAADIVMAGTEECKAAREILYEPCCYAIPTAPCILCAQATGSQGQVRDVSVDFYGSSTTCTDLNSFLVSREEQTGFMCQAAKTELQQECCFQECTVCAKPSDLYWDNPTTFNNMTFACGELSWILAGKSVEVGTPECSEMQSTYYEDCCNGPSALIPDAANKCEICPEGKDWYAQVIHAGKSITCLELDSALLQAGLFSGTMECEKAKLDYAGQCCYIPPERPCNLCQMGDKSYSVLDQTVTFNQAVVSCFSIHNYLSTRHEIMDDECVVTQNDLFDDCCYSKCSLCQEYQLDPEIVVTREGTTMGCSEIENSYIGLNQITQTSDQCANLQQEHFDSCCYDIPCNICSVGDKDYELLVDVEVEYMDVNRTCGDWSTLMTKELSQGDICKATKADIFDTCCFKACNLCTDPRMVINWNQPLTYDGLSSTCLDVYMNLRSEGAQDGDNECQSVQFTVSHVCCMKMPTNQCSLCQSSNGTYLNTNWNDEVEYQGEALTCGDMNALLAVEEHTSLLCLAARDELWNPCCTPHQGMNNSLLDLLGPPPLGSTVIAISDVGSDLSSWDYGTATGGKDEENGFGDFFRRPNDAHSRHNSSSFMLLMVLVVGIVLSLMI